MTPYQPIDEDYRQLAIQAINEKIAGSLSIRRLVGGNIAGLRNALELTVLEAAQMANMSPELLEALEAGEISITCERLSALAMGLGISAITFGVKLLDEERGADYDGSAGASVENDDDE